MTLATQIADELKTFDFSFDSTDSGLCSIITEHIAPKYLITCVSARIGIQTILNTEIMPEWPEFSGNWIFPIRCPDKYLPRAHNNLNSFDSVEEWAYYILPRYSGEYGEARLRLKDWLIEYFYKYPDCLSKVEKS